MIAGLVFAASAGAQAPTPASDAAERAVTAPSLTGTDTPAPAAERAKDESRSTAVVAAPGFEGLRAGVRAPVAREEVRTPSTIAMQGRGLSQAEVLMIVGGAAFLAGAIIGDDAGTLIMIGGAGIGLWGLYLYLQ
jgi:hypothetical protein